MDVKYIQSIMDRRKGAKASSSGKITTDYVQGVLNNRNTVNTSTQSVSASQTMPKPSVTVNRNSAPTTTALLDAVTNPMPKLDIKAPDRIKAPGTDSTQYRGHGFISQHELEDRGNAINSANASITLANMLGAMSVAGSQALYKDEIQRQVTEQMDRTGQDGNLVRDRLTEQFMEENPYVAPDNSDLEKWKTEQEAILAEARDLSKYSDEEIARAYENTDNYNIFERFFDFSTKNDALYTMKQLMNPTYNQYTREQTLQQLMESDKYKEFEGRFIPTSEAYVEFVNSLPTEQQFTRTQESLQREWAEANGYSYDDLKVLADGIISGDVTENIKRTSEEMPILSSALSPAFNVVGGMQGSLYGLTNAITGEPIAYDSNNFAAQKGAETIRETVSEQIDNPLGEFAYNTGMSIADSLLSQAVGGGKLGTTIMGMSAYSATLQDGTERGLTPAQMQTTALASGAAEYVFEKISWDKISLIARGQASPNILANIASQMATEGAEEGLTEIANIIVDDLVNGGASEMAQLKEFYLSQGMSEEEAEQKVFLEYAKQIGLSVAGGALSGGVTGGTASAYNRITGNNPNIVTEQNKRTEQGVNTDTTLLQASGESFNGNAENTAPVTQQSVNNEISMDSNTVLDANTATDTYKESAKQSIIKQIADIFNGKKHRDTLVDIGQTPSILQQYGASDFKMNMTQDTMFKIAYPEGYNGGKHNLGFDAIANLPYQISDPIAILKSDTQKDSLVVVTEFIDNNNWPIITAIHLNKNGMIEPANQIASMYGKRDFEKWVEIQKDKGNLLYENQNKGLNAVALAGLQLPSLYSESDPLFTNSIPNSTENVNKPTGRTMAEDTGARNTSGTVAEDTGVQGSTALNVSRTRTNTMMNSGTTTGQEAEQYMPESNFTYESVSEKESMQRAAALVNENGVDSVIEKEVPLEGYEIDALMIEYSTLMQKARETNDSALYKRANKVFRKIQTESTRNAQSLQSLAKWSRNTPEGQLAEAENNIRGEVEKALGKKRVEEAERKADLLLEKAEKVNKAKKDVEDERVKKVTTFSEKSYEDALVELQKTCSEISVDYHQMFQEIIAEADNIDRNTVIDILTKYGKINKDIAEAIKDDSQTQAAVLDYLYTIQDENLDLNSNRAKVLMAKAGKLLAKKIPSTFGSRMKQRLFNNMLESFKTIVSRNAGGNLGLALAEQLRQPIAAVSDRIVAKKTGYRTTTGWSVKKQTAYVKGMLKGISDEMLDLKNSFMEYKSGEVNGLHTARTGENTLPNAIELNKTAFNGNYGKALTGKLLNAKKGFVSKMLNLKNDYIKHGMSLGDRVFYESSYAQAKTEIELLIKSNYKVNPTDLNIDEYIDTAANLIALEAVFQNDTKLSKAFTQLKESIGEMSEGIIGMDIISQASFPFVKTPSNVVDIGIQYSPFGVVKNTINTVKEVKKGEFNQRRFVDETSRNIMGLLLLTGAIALFSKGITSGAYDNDKDVKNAQKEAGMQEYALRIGDTYMDVGYMPVIGQMIEAGAAFGNAFNESRDEGNGIASSLFSGLGAAGAQTVDSVFEQSMLSGLSELLGTSSYGDDDSFMEKMGKSALNIVGQMIPANVRNLANSLDEYQRYLGQYDTPEYTVNNWVNQIPFLRETLEVKYDNTGAPVLTNDGRGVTSRLFENMVFPGRITEANETALYNEAMRLYETTGSNAAFLPTPSRNDIKTDTFTPSSSDFVEYQQLLGTLNSSMAEAILDSEYYRNMDNASQVVFFSDSYEVLKQIAKSEIIPGFEPAQQYAKKCAVYEEKGIDGLVNLFYINHMLEGSSSTNEVLEVLNGMDMDDEDRGYYLYMKLSNPSASVENVLDTYGYEGVYNYCAYRNAADNGGTNPTQEEMTGFLSAQPNLTQSEKADWFDIYFPNAKENPFRQGGTGNTITGNAITIDYINEVINNRNR